MSRETTRSITNIINNRIREDGITNALKGYLKQRGKNQLTCATANPSPGKKSDTHVKYSS